MSAGVGFGLHSQWMRAGADEQEPGLPDVTSGLTPANAPSRLLLRRPTPCAVKGGAKHLDEEGGGYGHSQFTGPLERYPAAEAEERIRRAAIPGHARPRQPGRAALFTVDHLGRRYGDPQAALCGTGP